MSLVPYIYPDLNLVRVLRYQLKLKQRPLLTQAVTTAVCASLELSLLLLTRKGSLRRR